MNIETKIEHLHSFAITNSFRLRCNKQATDHNAWTNQIDIDRMLTVNHIQEFIYIWFQGQQVQATEGITHFICWNFSSNGE